ncbi:DUF7289 family protein [Halosimplex amylolyticum]|uniref:DUF7289 family protein n=1 Tax=Halosimplex amylolyticum TaxID=3396616 RepID=UPI003F55F5C9
MRLHDDERANRNMIGFTLTFGIIVVSVGLVAMMGYPQIDDLGRNERLDNAEAGMEQVASSFEQLQEQRATVRTNELSLSSGSLTVIDGPEVTVEAEHTDFDKTFDVGGLQYANEGTTITYENGAVFRTYSEDNIAIVDEPPMTCTENRAVVSVVRVVAESTDKTGADYVSVVGSAETRELRFPMNRTGEDSMAEADELFVTVDSPRSLAWDRHFEDAGNWTAGPTSGTFRCDGIDAMYVRETVISVSFDT